MNSKKTYLDAISTLAQFCLRHEIPFEFRKSYDGYQLTFPWTKGDVICHRYSFDSIIGRCESYNFPWDRGDVSVYSPEVMGMHILHYYKQIISE